ncbi:11716_t:CDS:10 [Dentiscutata heterogama]|uniref:11716_t:CDS:1 n=1 Tax=Dentiscutata heterogama TaxID=1316150 RepID=A0ACA9M5Z0_9GLOM|nr:11716_t:CDS:10 [Dentiscutata heterogama]
MSLFITLTVKNIAYVTPNFVSLEGVHIRFTDNQRHSVFQKFLDNLNKMVYTIPSLIEDKISPYAKKLIKLVDDFVEDFGICFFQNYYSEGVGLTNLEYALIAEITGRSLRIAPEAINCSAPDTGNMEVFVKYGTLDQKEKWLKPLLNGEIRSAFAMTEKAIASSDATNIETSIKRVGNHYVINGHKWWISGAGDPRCALFLVMGKPSFNANIHKQSVIIVPRNTPGITIVRPLTVFGYDDAPERHCEIIFKDVKVPVENIILGEGRGFEIIQGRLGPGRIHHCMRSIGAAERGLDLMLMRVTDPSRRTFGKLLAEHETIIADIAHSRMLIDQARLLVLNAADMIDKVGAKSALKEIGMAKVIVPSMLLTVIDRSIQSHGAGGLCDDFPLASLYASGRTLKFADGPDEVHIQQVGKLELKRARKVKEEYEKRPKIKNEHRRKFYKEAWTREKEKRQAMEQERNVNIIQENIEFILGRCRVKLENGCSDATLVAYTKIVCHLERLDLAIIKPEVPIASEIKFMVDNFIDTYKGLRPDFDPVLMRPIPFHGEKCLLNPDGEPNGGYKFGKKARSTSFVKVDMMENEIVLAEVSRLLPQQDKEIIDWKKLIHICKDCFDE